MITFEQGNYKSYDILLMVNIGGDEARIMRVGNAKGASQCILFIEHESEIDHLIDRLLEIRKQHTEKKQNT